MQQTDSHIITKLFLELNTHSKEKAYYLKDHLDTFLKEELLPLLETYFDTLDTKIPLHHIQIEKLDLNLSVGDELDLNTVKLEIVNQFRKQIEEQLEKGFPDTNQYKLIDRKDRKRDEFFAFLETGTSPWWAVSNRNGGDYKKRNSIDNNNNNNSDNNDIVNNPYHEILDVHEDNFLKKIADDTTFGLKLHRALENSQTRTRFIKQLSDDQIYNLLKRTLLLETTTLKKVTTEKVSEMIGKIKHQVNAFVWKSKQGLQQRNLIWDIVLLQLLQYQESDLKEKLLLLLNSFMPVNQFDPKLVSEQLRKYITDQSVLKILANLDQEIVAIKTLLEQKKAEILQQNNQKEFLKSDFSESVTSPAPENKPEFPNPTTAEIQTISDQNIKKEAEENLRSDAKYREPELQETREVTALLNHNQENKAEDHIPAAIFPENETIAEIPSAQYVNNAGLILVHPFLKSLFENCGLLNHNHTIKDPETAAHLLHYIATEREQDYESEMLFEKLLCNIPIHQTINRNIILPDALKKESNEMLQSVLENWPVMKDSSVYLLQNEYLQRPGKIILTEGNPKIIVERKTQDILLDKLNWNLGIVKLAWKNKIIFVDW